MLGIVHNGVAYPLIWEMLDKKGNSNSSERMDLLDRFHDIFPDAEIAYLTGDREFVGKQWLTYLLIEPIIPFRLRIKKSDRIYDGKKELRASIVFANLKPGQTQVLSGRRRVWGRGLESADCLRRRNAPAFGLCFGFASGRWGTTHRCFFSTNKNYRTV